MSSTTVINDSNPISLCAACGKVDKNLKACTACHLVKYCNRECQIAHRPKHKKECRKRSAELKHSGGDNTPNRNVNEILEGIINASISDTSTNAGGDKKVSKSYEQNCNNNNVYEFYISDDKLFAEPPPKEDCSICMLPIPYYSGVGIETIYMACCGTIMCYGCALAESKEMDKGNIKMWCSFCREPINIPYEKLLLQYKKRMKSNDSEAFYELGIRYRDGSHGLPQDYNKAFELWKRGAELGSGNAHYAIAVIYWQGDYGVKKDKERAAYHMKLAAIGGLEMARYNLGTIEMSNGDIKRAMKHFMIAATSGLEKSLKMVGEGYKGGFVTKDEYTSTLRAHQVSVDEMKSEQRTKAAEELSGQTIYN